MSDEKDDETDGSDWLASQFDPTAPLPKIPAEPEAAFDWSKPAVQPSGQPPVQPSVRPSEQPVQQPPAAGRPPAQQPPTQAQPPAQQPAVWRPPIWQQESAVPPAATPSAAVPPARPPTASPTSVSPPEGSGGGFNWGLRPGGAAGAEPSAASVLPVVPAPVFPPAPAIPVQPAGAASAGPVPQTPATQTPAPQSPAQSTQPSQAPTSQTPPLAQRMPWDPEPVDPSRAAASPEVEVDGVDQSTQAMSWQDMVEVQAPVVPAPLPAAPVPAAVQPPAPARSAAPLTPYDPNDPFGLLAGAAAPAAVPADPLAPRDPTSAIASLFGDTKFVEYEEQGVLQTITNVPAEGFVVPSDRPPRAPITKTQKILLLVAAALLGLVILVALYAAGVRAGTAAATAPTSPSSGAPTTAPTNAATGSLAPGTYAWNKLLGGECLKPFQSAWQDSYTVVDCGSDHTGQLILKGTLPDAAGSTYPSADAVMAEITPQCTDPKVFDYTVAGKADDVQLSASYSPNESDWQGGNRTFYCFVNRASGDPLPGDVVLHPAAK